MSIVEIDINPEILIDEKPEKPVSCIKKIKNMVPLHKKINSVNIKQSKIRQNKKITHITQSTTISNSSLQTPDVISKYKMTLQHLTTSINSLKSQYDSLIKENFNKKNRMHSFEMKFLRVKKIEEDKKKNKKMIEAKKRKLMINREILKRNQEIKKEYNEKKNKEIVEKKKDVRKLKEKEVNAFIKYKIDLENKAKNKKRIKEEEKQFIERGLSKQKVQYKKGLIKRKKINLEMNKKNEERKLSNEVYALKKKESDLLSKIKIQNAINNQFSKEYINYCKEKLNDDVIRNFY